MGGGSPVWEIRADGGFGIGGFLFAGSVGDAVAGFPAERGLMLGRGLGRCSLRSNLE